MAPARLVLIVLFISVTCCAEDEADPDAALSDAAAGVHASVVRDAEPTVDCSDATVSGGRCATMSEVCGTPSGCCVCGGFAGLCAQVWACATPAANDSECMPKLPEDLEECTMPRELHCQYCDAENKPYEASCSDASHYSECAATGAASCAWVSPLGAACD